MSFIPQGYVAPASAAGDYLKMPEDGKSIRFIPIGEMVAGYSYWDDNKTCHRSKEMFVETPGMPEDRSVKHFWLLNVLDLDSCTTKLLEVTQKSVQQQLYKLVDTGDYNYADGTNGFRISRVGKTMMDTKYTCAPTPVKPGEQRDAYDAVDSDSLPNLEKVAFEVRQPKSDITEVVPEVM